VNSCLVFQGQVAGDLLLVQRAAVVAARPLPHQLQQFPLADVERGVDRIVADDGGQVAGHRTPHEVAYVDQPLAHSAVDGRTDFGVAEFQFGLLESASRASMTALLTS
jgi:hypothetical protein